MPAPIPAPVRRALWQRCSRGEPAPAAARDPGLAPRTARRLLRRLRDRGPDGLAPSYRPPAGGPPPGLVGEALRLRRGHPTWGAGLVRVFLRRQRPGQGPPAERALQRWSRAAGLAPAPAGRRPAGEHRRAQRPPEVWQVDATERVPLRDGRRVSWLRVVGECSGAVLGTAVFPPGTGPRWARPGRLRVDNGFPWGSKGDLPTDLALWLIGLGVEVTRNRPRRPQGNGAVERGRRTGRCWAEPHTRATAEELEGRFAELDRTRRGEYPVAGGRTRWELYPGLAHSGRRYSAAWEESHWDPGAARGHPAAYAAARRVNPKGMVSVYDRSYYVGAARRGQVVWLVVDPARREGVAVDAEGRELRRWPAEELSRQAICEPAVTRRRGVPRGAGKTGCRD